ncbi:MAG: hypothetical protein K0R31_962 [Clostridiales bacterium]|nr:hypothetical protein [Clostridiales bacterium]
MDIVLKRHRMIIILLSMVVIAAIAWLFLSRLGNERIPTRGVYVMEAASFYPIFKY